MLCQAVAGATYYAMRTQGGHIWLAWIIFFLSTILTGFFFFRENSIHNFDNGHCTAKLHSMPHLLQGLHTDELHALPAPSKSPSHRREATSHLPSTRCTCCRCLHLSLGRGDPLIAKPKP